MFERNDDVLYICYDNEAYMNTGVQRSSATPPAARTATTSAGNRFGQGKNLPVIAIAHGIPYVATATIAELHDLEAKVRRAMEFRGARYIHIFVSCPLGWGHAADASVQIARLAKETGLFPVYEAEHGEVTSVSKIRRRLPVEDYLKRQRRFAHLFSPQVNAEAIARIQEMADRNIRKYGLLDA
jgi:pyruvate ferredoxin oxidoreductase beta subunit